MQFWRRGIGLAALLAILIGWFKYLWTSDWRRWLWLGLHVVSIIVVLTVTGVGPASYAFALAINAAFIAAVLLTGSGVFVGASANVGACALAFVLIAALDIAIAGSAAHAGGGAFIVAIAGAFLVALVIAAIIAFLISKSVTRNRLGWFLFCWTLTVFLIAIGSPRLLAHLSSWHAAGALLLFTVAVNRWV